MRVRKNLPECNRLLKVDEYGVGMLGDIKDHISRLVAEMIELWVEKCVNPLSVFIQFVPRKREMGVVYRDGGKLTGTF